MVKAGLGARPRPQNLPRSRSCALSGRASWPMHRSRPLSPHLSIWRWGPHMVVSILHRATGVALSIAGLAHPGLVADSRWPADRRLCDVHQGRRRSPLGLDRADRHHLELLPASAVRHPPFGDGYRRGVRARHQQDLCDPDDRRFGTADGAASGSTSWEWRNEPRRQRDPARQGPRPRLGAPRRRALADGAGHQHRAAVPRHVAASPRCCCFPSSTSGR